ncbi:MAG: hypothetical protein V2J24_00195 [Pseudomonadales bacterium]|jgi:hypothetical protein|nr:hypothetical protein [Pseudomonadales bacterium]
MDETRPDLRIGMSVEPDYRHLAFEGVLSNDGLVRELGRLWGSDDYAYDRAELYDLRGITSSALDSNGVQLAAALDLDLFADQPDRRSAIVAGNALHFGLARMFQAYLGEREANVRVFGDFDEAVAWLVS